MAGMGIALHLPYNTRNRAIAYEVTKITHTYNHIASAPLKTAHAASKIALI